MAAPDCASGAAALAKHSLSAPRKPGHQEGEERQHALNENDVDLAGCEHTEFLMLSSHLDLSSQIVLTSVLTGGRSRL